MATSERVSSSLRRQVSEQARGLCEYCRCPAHFTNASFHCEHIRPRNAGGRTALDNLAWACPWCNSHKYTKTHAQDPHTGRRVPLFNPRRQQWSRHFAWSDSFLLYTLRSSGAQELTLSLSIDISLLWSERSRSSVLTIEFQLLAAGTIIRYQVS